MGMLMQETRRVVKNRTRGPLLLALAPAISGGLIAYQQTYQGYDRLHWAGRKSRRLLFRCAMC